ncbi:pyridoxal phosphate-dependent aminotransferase family protein [Prosthecochloris sp. N3]|uniref:Pyridoxal phosphate-dependent aminotransferase family protein n=1 Tax=Prosthecochloris ethylica TaxID=2743976 RepID=A0ABR9XPG6_9CHLB|nr:pyridoxal phosphate-dependent aminotransferase family protein [Prosthecochloris sp. ZM_2]MBF0585786.1 pyridoxal phosphate-dependent aminotransferase family protein [Prosthecochloris ethylica]MEC9486513.1 pyridoxal phosphate-dependent aminotransferase family protein [Prosthecochloris sp.]MBF0635696.1 pyridoxal phosphate-dependent aminotransferase family protein [Prosthecochloris ethylica]NUK46995.1 pyridoxal phosphate-dependent aminotransferase family protein [Prosthecochloris ethylica]RNA65
MNTPKDLFKKCYDFTLADDVKAQGIYPFFHPIDETEGPVVSFAGNKLVMAGSNNYLGLTADPRVKEASINAIKKYGTSCSGSRYMTGTVNLHIELEEKLADFFEKERCLLFSTGYQTGQGVIPTLVQRGEYVISDKDNHASLVAASIMAVGQSAKFVRYAHNSMDDLERVLKNIPETAGKLIVSDGVFSVSGEIVDLDHLVDLAKKYHARILIDDAHAVGVIGKGGRGTPSEFNRVDDVDLVMGTFSKTFGSLGGYVAGERSVINYIKHNASSLIFSASPTPASVAAVLASLEIIKSEPDLTTRLLENTDYVRQGLKNAGFKLMPSRTAIVSVIIGDQMKTMVFWKKLFDAGVYVNAFIRPGVMPGHEALRTSFMATHEKEHLDKVITEFCTIGRELEII